MKPSSSWARSRRPAASRSGPRWPASSWTVPSGKVRRCGPAMCSTASSARRTTPTGAAPRPSWPTDDQVTGEGNQEMIDDERRDRAEIHDLFNRYADAVSGHQWELLDEVFTEDVTGAWRESPEIEGRPALVHRIRDVI